MTALLLLVALLGAGPSPTRTVTGLSPIRAAETPSLPVIQLPSAQDDRRYEVVLLTMDQGEEVWELFGHNALVIRDTESGQAIAWNWGLFDFEQVDFIPRFLRGTMLYTMGPADPESFLDAYVRANRTVFAHQVLLTDSEAGELDAFVRTNFLPENRNYTYHYFLDNCSTRLRDALDGVLGGILQERFAARETTRSFRWHARRLVQVRGWVDQGLSFLLGARGDRPITEWEAMYVPMVLMERLEEVERVGSDGNPVPLLGPREVLYRSDRPATREGPPSFHLAWVGLGLLIAGLVGTLGTVAARAGAPHPGQLSRSAAAWAFLGVATAWAAFGGLLGLLLVLAWFTDHDFIHVNVNVLYTSPLLLLLPPLLLFGLLARSRGGGAVRRATELGLVIAGLSVAAALAQLTRLIDQGNGEVVAVALPINLALAWALVRIRGDRDGLLRRVRRN